MPESGAMRAFAHFSPGQEIFSAEPIGFGLVNATYLVTAGRGAQKRQYVLQRLADAVFGDLSGMMENIRLVTEHLTRALQREGVDPQRRTLTFLPCDEGGLLYRGEDGGIWRAYRYIEGAVTYDHTSSCSVFYEAGRGVGAFERRLDDFPVECLRETLPGFHDTPARYAALTAAAEEDPLGRAAEVCGELRFFRSRREQMGRIAQALADGTLPLRAVHNDTKLSNLLFDAATGQALCLIDFDTVMPGSVLCDYGDAVRSGAAAAKEDADDIQLDMDLFRRFTDGFLKETNGILTAAERRMLPLGVQIVTCELAMRFLTDYLTGEHYFKVDYPGHCLVRARAQIRLLETMEQHEDEMRSHIGI